MELADNDGTKNNCNGEDACFLITDGGDTTRFIQISPSPESRTTTKSRATPVRMFGRAPLMRRMGVGRGGQREGAIGGGNSFGRPSSERDCRGDRGTTGQAGAVEIMKAK